MTANPSVTDGFTSFHNAHEKKKKKCTNPKGIQHKPANECVRPIEIQDGVSYS